MRTFKRITAFVIINAIVFFSLHFLFTKPSMLDALLREFHSGDYNAVILGESIAETGINPLILSDNNETVYNMSRRVLPFPDIYYLLKELNSKQTLDTVYLELDAGYWKNDYYNSLSRGWDVDMLWHLSWPLKVQYFREVTAKRPIFALGDYPVNPSLVLNSIKNIIPNIKARTKTICMNNPLERIETINTILNIQSKYKYLDRGYQYGIVSVVDQENYYPNVFQKNKISATCIEYFQRICEYCEENNIRLICFSSCLPYDCIQYENHEEKKNFFTDLCSRYDVQYYDLSYAKKEYLCYSNEDFVDLSGHVMGHLADKQTYFLREVVHSQNQNKYFCDSLNEVISKFQ